MSREGRVWRDALTIAGVLLLFAGFALTPFRPSKFGDRNFHVEARERLCDPWGGLFRGVWALQGAGTHILLHRPLSLRGSRLSGGAYWRAAVVWSALCVCLAMVLLRRTGEELGGTRAGWVTLVLALAPPFVVYYSFGILSEPPAFVGAVLAGYGWARWLRRGERPYLTGSWWIAWAGVAILLLCRPNALFLLAAAALCALALLRSAAPARRRAAVFILTGLAVPLAASLASILLVRVLGGGWQERNLARRDAGPVAVSG